jgi:hypothetical protein
MTDLISQSDKISTLDSLLVKSVSKDLSISGSFVAKTSNSRLAVNNTLNSTSSVDEVGLFVEDSSNMNVGLNKIAKLDFITSLDNSSSVDLFNSSDIVENTR